MLSRLGHQGTTWIPIGASRIPCLSHTGSSFVSSTMRWGERQGNNDASGDGLLPDRVRCCFRQQQCSFHQKKSGTQSRENPSVKPPEPAPPPRFEEISGIRAPSINKNFPSSLSFSANLRPAHSCPETRRSLTSPGRKSLPTILSLGPVLRTRLELRLN